MQKIPLHLLSAAFMLLGFSSMDAKNLITFPVLVHIFLYIASTYKKPSAEYLIFKLSYNSKEVFLFFILK